MADNSRTSKLKAYLVPIVIMIVMGLLLFLPAGSLRYWPGWFWWFFISAVTLYITAFFVDRDRGLLARRMNVREKEPQPTMIRILSPLTMFTFILPGFDHRLGWSAVPVGLVIAANLVVSIPKAGSV